MKTRILLFFFLMVIAPAAICQRLPKDGFFYIDSVGNPLPVGNNLPELGLLIGDNQKLDAKFDLGTVSTPPTIISVSENPKGFKYVKLYVNCDFVNIACPGLTIGNFNEYTLLKQILQPKDKLTDEKFAMPMSFEVTQSGQAYIGDSKLNEEKERLYNSRFQYFVKNKKGKTVSLMTLEFVFPKPELALITINEAVIGNAINRPGEATNFNNRSIADLRKELAAANMANTNGKDSANVPSKLVLRSGIHAAMFRFKSLTVDIENYLEYKLNEGDWKTTVKGLHPFVCLNNLHPGKYTLQARYPGQAAVFIYEFEVSPAFYQTFSFKVIIGSVITIFLLALLFRVVTVRQKIKLRNEQAKRAQLQNQLTSLQAQLQPHFIFNALNSIQGLINKRNIEEANVYISKFGSLLHEIIGQSGKDMHPLMTELKQLEYYLQLEQLRFKFQYRISIKETVNISEINIPAMLLQPFVENAIKHGIVEKKESGLIELSVDRSGSTLMIQIADNGKGYNTPVTHAGKGNALVTERVQVLNSYLKGQRIEIKVQSGEKEGTKVLLYFYDWL